MRSMSATIACLTDAASRSTYSEDGKTPLSLCAYGNVESSLRPRSRCVDLCKLYSYPPSLHNIFCCALATSNGQEGGSHKRTSYTSFHLTRRVCKIFYSVPNQRTTSASINLILTLPYIRIELLRQQRPNTSIMIGDFLPKKDGKSRVPYTKSSDCLHMLG